MDQKNDLTPEISMYIPLNSDQHNSKHEFSSNQNLHKPINPTKAHAKRNDSESYGILSTILRQTEHQFEYKIILEIFIFVCFVTIIIASFITQQLKQQLFLGLQAWKWILLVGAALCGLSIIRLGTYTLLRCLIEPLFKLTKDVVFFARGLKTSVDVLLWLCLILVFWLVWFHKGIKSSEIDTTEIKHYVVRSLIALVLGAFFWVLKDILLLRLESDLHLNRLYARIRYAILHLHGIQMVDKGGEWSFAGVQPDEREKLVENVYSMKKGAPTWVLKSLTKLFEKSLEEISLPHVNYEFCDAKVLIDNAGSKLLQKVVDTDNHHTNNKSVSLEDVKNRLRFTEKEAHVLLSLFRVYKTENNRHHQHNNDEVDHKTFVIWVTHAYRTCWSVKRTLKNTRGSINQFNKLLISFLVAVTIVIWLLLTEIASQSTIALALSPFLAASFIFGDSCKTMFQGIIFAFVMHPFEVGDRCIIAGEQMTVNRINILTTELTKCDNGESVIYPNSVLATKEISNLRAIRNQEDSLQFNIDLATRCQQIEDLKTRIKRNLQEHTHFSSEVEVVLENFGKIGVHFKYLVSQPDMKEKAKWKSELISSIHKILQELDISLAT